MDEHFFQRHWTQGRRHCSLILHVYKRRTTRKLKIEEGSRPSGLKEGRKKK